MLRKDFDPHCGGLSVANDIKNDFEPRSGKLIVANDRENDFEPRSGGLFWLRRINRPSLRDSESLGNIRTLQTARACGAQ